MQAQRLLDDADFRARLGALRTWRFAVDGVSGVPPEITMVVKAMIVIIIVAMQSPRVKNLSAARIANRRKEAQA
mgnify:CR=1 FL=1